MDVRYPQGGGLTAGEREFREQVRLAAAEMFADGAKSHSPQTNQVTTMRVDHHGHGDRGWHDGRHGDRDGRRGYYLDGYYRHHCYDYCYPYYYDGYYARCRWAYYHDPYWFDRYCRGYYY